MKFPSETLQLDLTIALLKLCGHWLGERNSYFRLFQRFRAIILCLSLALWITASFLVYLDEGYGLFKRSYAAFLLTSFLITVFNAHFQFIYDLIENFVVSIKRLRSKNAEDWEREVFERLTSKLWKYMTIFVINVLVSVIFQFLLPIIMDAVVALFSNSLEPYFIKPLPLEGFIKKRRSVWFYLLQLIDFLMMVNCTLAWVGLYSGILIFITYLNVELEILCMKMQKWSEHSDMANRKAYLGEIIDRHAEIMRQLKAVRAIYGPFHNTQNIVCSIVIPFLLHSTFKGSFGNNWLVFTGDLYSTIFMTVITFLPCYMGEMIKTKGTKFAGTIYNIPWNNENPKIVKDIQLILLAAQKPATIEFYNEIGLNLNTYSNLSSSAYSIFLFLESSL